MLFLIFNAMEKLNLDFITVPGKEAYTSASVSVNELFFIAIIAEGKEESIYLNYVKDKVNSSSTLRLRVEVLNEHYIKEKYAISESHPLKRLEVLKEWNKRIQKLSIKGDEEWIICDRDNRSFTSDQYDKLLSEAFKLGIHVVVSNPAFQIWLLFHFTHNLSSLKLDTYTQSKDRLKCVENEIKIFVSNYKHGSLNMDDFKGHVREAMENSSHYPLDLKVLKDSSGTNFRDLLSSIETYAKQKIFD